MPLIAEYAKRFGIYDDLAPYLPMSLGAGETTLLRLVTAYATIANGGRKVEATLVDRVQDRSGETSTSTTNASARTAGRPIGPGSRSRNSWITASR